MLERTNLTYPRFLVLTLLGEQDSTYVSRQDAAPAGEAAWHTIPSWFLIPTAEKNIPLEAQRFMAHRATPATSSRSTARRTRWRCPTPARPPT